MTKVKKILIAFFTILLFYSLITWTKMHWQNKSENDKIQELVQMRSLAEGVDAQGAVRIESDEEIVQETVILSEFQELYQRNSDLIGWLTIGGTRIDYPIMHNKQDPVYYLNHGFDKESNMNGLPFVDEQSDIEGSTLLFIHGHHMKSGSMFADLEKYKKENFYKDHPTFQYSTLYQQQSYEIIAVILSKVYNQTEDVFKYYQIDNLKTQDDFHTYMQNMKQLALYETGVTAQYGDKLIILSTCEYSVTDGRLAIIARQLPND